MNQTYLARVAALLALRGRVAKVLAEDGVAAEGALAVLDHNLEALDGRLGPVLLTLRLGGAQLLLEEERHGLPLLPRVVHPAVRLLAVPARPARLLVVAGNALCGNSFNR